MRLAPSPDHVIRITSFLSEQGRPYRDAVRHLRQYFGGKQIEGRSVLRILQQSLRICVPQAEIEKYSNIHWRHTNNSRFGCVTSTSKFSSLTRFIQSIQLSPHQHCQQDSSFLAVQSILLKLLNKSNCCWFHIISYTAFLLWIAQFGCAARKLFLKLQSSFSFSNWYIKFLFFEFWIVIKKYIVFFLFWCSYLPIFIFVGCFYTLPFSSS